jgi:cyclase
LGLDARKTDDAARCPCGYEVVINGGRSPAGLDALAWAKKAEELGAGEICLNSIDADGTLDGYEINLTRLISSNVTIPVIASGGAGRPEHLQKVLTDGGASAALIASIVHYGQYAMSEVKAFLGSMGVRVRTVRDLNC